MGWGGLHGGEATGRLSMGEKRRMRAGEGCLRPDGFFFTSRRGVKNLDDLGGI